MVLVDTSIWIELFGKKPRIHITSDELLLMVTCPQIIQEVLQGIRNDLVHFQIKTSLLALTRVGDPGKIEDHLTAADIYRTARKKGLTIRSSVDCLIAAIAIREQLPVWHRDRDFEVIAKFTSLSVRSVKP